MLQNMIEEMNNIILQPSGSSIANEHYHDTIKNRIDLDLVGRFVSNNDLLNLSEIYQGQACMIRNGRIYVTPGRLGSNITKWNRISSGDLVTLYFRFRKWQDLCISKKTQHINCIIVN